MKLNAMTLGGLVILCILITRGQSTHKKCEVEQDHPENESFERLCEPKWGVYHTFSAATDAPIATVVSSQPEFVGALKTILEFFKQQGNKVVQKVHEKQSAFDNPPDAACNIREDEFDGARFEAVNNSMSSYGWGVMAAPCATELKLDPKETPVDAMRTYLKVLDAVKIKVTQLANMNNWTNPSTFNRFSYTSDTESCTLLHFAAFRKDGVWGLNTAVTNDNPTVYQEEFKRWYLNEILKISNGTITPTPLHMRKLWQGSGWEPNTTTLLAIWGGAPATSIFKDIFNAANNPAVTAAIAIGNEVREQVQDATTPSNIAILIVPLALAAIPLAIFSEVTKFSLLCYTIMTDIVSVMPLAIKGYELIQFGAKEYKATRVWVYGARDTMDLTAAESWYAECDASLWVTTVGRVYLSIAILAMILGIMLEIVAKRILTKRRLLRREKLLEEWDSKSNQLWYKGGCKSCNCTRTEIL